MIYRRLFNVPKRVASDPFGELDRMRRQMDRLFSDVMAPYQRPRAGVFPSINLTEDANSYYVRAELPGVKADDLDIQITAKDLSLSGERKNDAEEDDSKYHRKERDAGKFSRIIGLPGEISSEAVDAKLENGILTVVIAKAETAKPKQITVS